MNYNLIQINNLHVSINNTPILKGVNLTIKAGEIHTIMGKNGSGKSTLAKVIAGHPNYNITHGDIQFDGQSILNMKPEERAIKGIFLAFQYPIEIPGVSNADFLRIAYNAKQKAYKKKALDPLSFFEFINQYIEKIDMNPQFLSRNVNEGFSGGEKKKNEILQMILLDSKLGILDEIDSGLDIDALKNISTSINSILTNEKSIMIITHYQRILDYIIPDYIHIMEEGKIVYTGNADTAKQLEKYGYESIIQKQRQNT
uniref:Iron-sulfur cluster formation ABC transporter ATP-binding subunit n=1 Tax=Hypnea edeniana TaxID=1524265 RepID=UPI0023F2EA1C|nr:Iron-sulfur cluster formation ABC transporter ATP-binding subunit [Hypnea edeniana]WCH54720.1 Iron-sulfur cluster formation ABC transporter ATP-binding subunit [Hypnea edeniana]WDY85152.1 Iron-sulfur cluster formation ABC transporter ATP-binding subunit [Hypnea edeniana]